MTTTTITNPVLDEAERKLLEALSSHIDAVADDIRSQAAQHVGAAKSGLVKLAAEADNSDPLVQAMIEDALEDYERVPDFFAAVVRRALEWELEPLRQPTPETAEIIEGTAIVVEVDNSDEETESQDKGDRS